jgi:WD40 repeat protein
VAVQDGGQLDQPRVPVPADRPGLTARMRGGITSAVRAGGELRTLGPTALVSFLFAAAFAPFLAPLLGHLPGVLEAELGTALNQLGGMGGGYLGEVLSKTADRMRGDEGGALTEEQLRRQLAEALHRALGEAAGEVRSGLREELSVVLRRLDAVHVAMAADDEGALAEGLAGLGERMAEFHWVLDDVRAALGEVLRALDSNAAQQRGQWRSVRASQDAAISLMLRIESTLRPGPGDAAQPGDPGLAVCPYPGLLPFEGEDARWFFGREELSLHLVSRVAQQAGGRSPLFVLGPSGAGKSSLLRAGLIPRLSEAGAGIWSPVLLGRPGAHPMEALSRQVPARAGTGAGGRLVLVVDQFEEIFTQCPDEGERLRFVRALLDLPGALVVLGIRTDFYQDCAAIPELGTLLPDNQLLVGPMAERDLRRAVIAPATAAGYAVEPGLTELLLSDLGVRPGSAEYEPGALPLLAYALQATWSRRSGKTLTVAGYREVGGVHGAVAAEAELVYADLPGPAREATRRVMLRLVSVGRGTRPARSRVPRAALAAALDAAAAENVLGRFTQARLITADAGGVEISHEALLGAWPRLREWIEEDQAGLVLHRQLAEDAASWIREERDPGGLYRGARLASALGWQRTGDNEAELTPAERELLTASAAAEEVRRAAQEAGRLRERRQNRRLRALAGGLAVVLAAAVAAAGYAVGQQHQAQAQRDYAVSSLYAAQSDDDQTTNPTVADLDALAGWAADETPQARGSLLSREANPYLASFPEPAAAVIKALAISPDGKLLAVGEEPSQTAAGQGSVQLWDVAQRKEVADFPHLGGIPLTLAFSPDGSTVAAVVPSVKANLQLWDVATHKALPDPIPPQRFFISTLAYSPDGRILAVGTALPSYGPGGGLLPVADDRTVIELWDLAGHHLLRELTGGTGLIYSLAFSPDGRQLAGGGEDHMVRLWNVATGTQQAVLGGSTGTVGSVSFSPDGRFLAAASLGGTIRIWNAPAGTPNAVISTTSGVPSGVPPMAFSPRGQYLYTSPAVGEIVRYNLNTGAQSGPVVRLPPQAAQDVDQMVFSPDGNTLAVGGLGGYAAALDEGGRTFYEVNDDPLTSVAVSPDGRLTATGDADGTVQLWGTSNPAYAHVLTGNQGDVLHVAFSPDGKLLAAISATCTASLWNVASGRLIATLATPGRYLVTPDDNGSNLSFGPDGKTVATYCSSSNYAGPKTIHDTVMLWRTATKRPITAYQVPNGGDGAGGLAYSPDGHTLAIDTGTGDVLLWDTASRRIARVIETGQATTPGALAITFSPDGKLLATAGPTGTIALWDAASGDPAGSVNADTQQVHDLAFSPDGSILAAAGQDSVVRLWSVPGLQQVASVSATPQTLSANNTELTVNEVAFGPGGRTLVSANSDGTAQVWDLNPADAVRDLCGALGPAWVAGQWPGLDPSSGQDPCSPG